jgi:NarL family two-component system sensor histidine kinase YdfH
VREEADRLSRTAGVECTMQLDALAGVPDAAGEHVLATIVEAVSNVTRHAQASQVQIKAVKRDDSVVITVLDDGVGFDIAQTQPAGHFGLLGLRERARLTGGRLEIHSTPGHGTRLVLRVPLQAEIEPR